MSKFGYSGSKIRRNLKYVEPKTPESPLELDNLQTAIEKSREAFKEKQRRLNDPRFTQTGPVFRKVTVPKRSLWVRLQWPLSFALLGSWLYFMYIQPFREYYRSDNLTPRANLEYELRRAKAAERMPEDRHS